VFLCCTFPWLIGGAWWCSSMLHIIPICFIQYHFVLCSFMGHILILFKTMVVPSLLGNTCHYVHATFTFAPLIYSATNSSKLLRHFVQLIRQCGSRQKIVKISQPKAKSSVSKYLCCPCGIFILIVYRTIFALSQPIQWI
jgi:hypothetical protein